MQQWFIILVGMLVATGLGFLLYKLVKLLTRKIPIELSACQKLVQEVAYIRTLIVNKTCTPEFFYVQLTRALKTFLTIHCNYQIIDKTDDEIANLLTSAQISEDLLQHMRTIFAQASVYKFSHEITSDHHMIESLDQLHRELEQLMIIESLQENSSSQNTSKQ